MKNYKSFEIDPNILKNKKYVELDNGLDKIYQNVKKIKPENSNQIYYLKSLDTARAIGTAASAKMYNDIGIKTPNVQVFKDQKTKNEQSIIQPDVTQNEDIETILAKNDVEYKKMFLNFSSRHKWQIFYDYDLQRQFLKHMTPKCLESLKNIYLIDELRSDSDRSLDNYFLYKNHDSKLYEGIIVIDLTQMQIYNYVPTTKTAFSDFTFSSYTSLTPTQKEDCTSYINRIHMLRELIDDGVMSEHNIETMVKALKYDFPKEVQNLCKKQKLSHHITNQVHSPIAKLWEYNQKELGKDLGL